MGDVSLDRSIKAEPATLCIAQGNQITHLMSAGGTEERHTLYISSMESSFMDKFYKCRRNVNQNDSGANGFKVLRAVSPWIRRFRPRDCSSNARGDGAETSASDHESLNRSACGRTPLSHGRELGACKAENHLDENTEVSDQNFADDEAEADEESSKARKRRKLSSTSDYCTQMIK